MNKLFKLFTEHPKKVGETYFQHLKVAFGMGLLLLILGVVCSIHAILPFLFEKTTSTKIKQLCSFINDRNNGEYK